jgi:hypothetical protein
MEHTQTVRRRSSLALLVALAFFGSLLISGEALAQGPPDHAVGGTEHCPDHRGHPGKVDSGKAGNDVVVAKGTVFCVKAGPYSTGKLSAMVGGKTLLEYVEDAGIRVGRHGKNVPDVSYYVVYKEPKEKDKDKCKKKWSYNCR